LNSCRVRLDITRLTKSQRAEEPRQLSRGKKRDALLRGKEKERQRSSDGPLPAAWAGVDQQKNTRHATRGALVTLLIALF
jgi:hypothetical protein